jgi:hypothetical protein
MQSQYPASFWEILEKAAVKSRETTIDKAVEWATKEWLKHPDHEEYIRTMIAAEIRSRLHDVRSGNNKKLRKKMSKIISQPSSNVGGNREISQIIRTTEMCRNDYAIDGMNLGDLTVAELLPTAEKLRQQARGVIYNAEMCIALYNKASKEDIKENKKVKDYVSLADFRRICKKVDNKMVELQFTKTVA